jgi:hypothetical protein
VNPETLHALSLDATAYPLVLQTRDGESYTLPDRRHLWLPPSYPDTVVVCPPGRGVILLTIGSIEQAD